MDKNEEEDCRLYLITPEKFDALAFRNILIRALDSGDVAAVQLRMKGASDDEIKLAADLFVPVANARGVTIIMNDRPDLAVATGCDGVHIGQKDAEVGMARIAVGNDKVVGVTCHNSRHLGMEAGEKGADYVAFGAFFPTSTKQTKARAGPDILSWWSEFMVIPVVAIGGITINNCPPLVRAGANFLAVVSAVWDHPDGPAAAVKQFNKVITENRP